MAKTKDTNTTTEYIVSYDAVDGVRRTANALDTAGAQQIINDLHEDEARRQLLAQSVGLSVPAHDYNFEISETTTSTKPIQL